MLIILINDDVGELSPFFMIYWYETTATIDLSSVQNPKLSIISMVYSSVVLNEENILELSESSETLIKEALVRLDTDIKEAEIYAFIDKK